MFYYREVCVRLSISVGKLFQAIKIVHPRAIELKKGVASYRILLYRAPKVITKV